VSVFILLGLVIMWVVVLVPMWLRRHDEAEEIRSVDKFTSAMHTLSRREAAVDKKYVVMPHRTRSHDVHVSGASADGRAGLSRPAWLRMPHRERSQRVLTAAARRRRTLLGLLVVTFVTLVTAVLVGGIALWSLQFVADACLVSFVVHLRNRARRAAVRPARGPAVSRPAASRPIVADDEVDSRVGSGEDVALVVGSRLDGVRVDEVEDDVVDDERFEPVAVPMAVGGTPSFFDQPDVPETDVLLVDHGVSDRGMPAATPEPRRVEFEPVGADAAERAAGDVPGRAPERPAARQRPETPGDRAFGLDIALSAGPSEPSRNVDDGIGARPWEPVPVPRPVYTSKPPAPPRSPRAPEFEPILPAVDQHAELDPVDDLEEILDRRWAVND
jgi:hypothetical protein